MTQDEFKQALQIGLNEYFREHLGLETRTDIRQLTKTNTTRDTLTVQFGDSPIAPSIPVGPLFEEHKLGTSVEEIIEREAEILYDAYRVHPELPSLTPEEAKEHITLTLVNSKMNLEILANTPHFQICGGELSAIPRWYISPEASFIVNNDITARLGLTPDEILQLGQRNIDNQTFIIKGMGELMAEMMGLENSIQSEDEKMLVLTTQDRIQGAKALLSNNVLAEVHDRLGDFAILPSSIHEVICIPQEGTDPEELRAMVREVNETQVSPEERLSDNVMAYDGISLRLANSELKVSPEISQDLTYSMSM